MRELNLLVGGRYRAASNGRTFERINPLAGEPASRAAAAVWVQRHAGCRHVARGSVNDVDATLRFDPSSKSYFVEGYVYNLGNKRILLAPENESWGLIFSAYAPLRRFGVRAGFKF